jgi:hypothetical protein
MASHCAIKLVVSDVPFDLIGQVKPGLMLKSRFTLTNPTFTTGVCGEAIIPYQIPITTTEGGYTISSFLNNGNAKQAEMGINVLKPEPEPDQQIYLPIILKE